MEFIKFRPLLRACCFDRVLAFRAHPVVLPKCTSKTTHAANKTRTNAQQSLIYYLSLHLSNSPSLPLPPSIYLSPTPSHPPLDLLPQEGNPDKEVFPCHFEPGSEGRILRTLVSEVCSARVLQAQWSVTGVLDTIAKVPEHKRLAIFQILYK